MRKKSFLFFLYAGLFSFTLTLTSCGEDHPPPAPTDYIVHHKKVNGPPVVSSSHPGIINSAIWECDDPGTNCDVIIPLNTPIQGLQASIANFKSHLQSNTLAVYFDTDPSWVYVFPTLSSNSIMLARVVDGTYRVAMSPDDKGVILFTGNTLDENSIVMAFNFQF